MAIRILGWNRQDITGNKLFDNQNKRLVELTNQFIHALNEDPEQNSGIEDFISMLSNHATCSFGNEDSLINTLEYGSSTIHKKDHERFFEMIDKFRKDIKKSTTPKKILKFLRTWKREHIRVQDMLLARKLKEHEDLHS